MSWISELDKYGYNFLIDELVWHVEQGRIPLSVQLIDDSEHSGYEFSFLELEPMFLKVNQIMVISPLIYHQTMDI